MRDEINLEQLSGRWIHSHEEDHDDLLVFRAGDHDFPPSRGRLMFNLKPDGVVEVAGPGPNDRPVGGTGSWQAGGTHLTVSSPTWAGDFEIRQLEDDKLVLNRL